MSFDSESLQADILELFEERAHATKHSGITYAERSGFSMIRSADERKEITRQWRIDNAAYVASVEYRESAKQRVREWRAKIYADPALHAAHTEKRRAWYASYSDANRELINHGYRERRRKLRATATPKKPRNIRTHRNIQFLAWVTSQTGDISAADAMRDLGMSRSLAGHSLRRRMVEGLIERVRFGIYRAVSK